MEESLLIFTEKDLLVFILIICYVGFGLKTLLYFVSNKKSSIILSFPLRLLVFLFWFIVPVAIIFAGGDVWEDD